jgi:hypothetical protein
VPKVIGRAFIHVLTVVHALGALACFVMVARSAASASLRDTLAVAGGSTIMVERFGPSPAHASRQAGVPDIGACS